MMSRRAFLLALLAFAGSVGGYLLSRGMLPWLKKWGLKKWGPKEWGPKEWGPKKWGPKKWAGPL